MALPASRASLITATTFLAIGWGVWTAADHQTLGSGAAEWLPTPKAALRRETAAARSVLFADLRELQFHRGLATKDGEQGLELVALAGHLDHLALEVLERTSSHKDLIAFGEIHLDDGLLLGSTLEDAIHLRAAEGTRLDVTTGLTGGAPVFSTDEIDHVRGASHRHHGVLIQHHPHQHITGEHLLLGGLTGAVLLQLDGRGLGNLDFENSVAHTEGDGPLLQGGLDLLLAAGGHLNGVPTGDGRVGDSLRRQGAVFTLVRGRQIKHLRGVRCGQVFGHGEKGDIESAEHLGRSPPKEATDSRDGGGRKADHQDHSDGFAEQLLAAGPDHEFQLINRVRQKTTGFGGIGSGLGAVRSGGVLRDGAGHGEGTGS